MNDGKAGVFWGHTTSAKEDASKEALTEQAAKRCGWTGFDFEVVALIKHHRPGTDSPIWATSYPAAKRDPEAVIEGYLFAVQLRTFVHLDALASWPGRAAVRMT